MCMCMYPWISRDPPTVEEEARVPTGDADRGRWIQQEGCVLCYLGLLAGVLLLDMIYTRL